MSEVPLRPGLRLGVYPQKIESSLTKFEQDALLFFENTRYFFSRKRFNQTKILKKIEQHAELLTNCSEEALTAAISILREKLQRHGLKEDLIAQAFAIIREAANRTLGKRHFDVQIYGGWLMIHGMLVEMATGEGKTLTTTLPACTAAMAGIPVHVITANDYLAARDADLIQPLYQRLGISAGSVIDGMETEDRRFHYRKHIVHTTNKQIAFDYLRDRIEMGEDTGPLMSHFRQIQRELNHNITNPLLLRGLSFAIIDEADSVLIDEAKTPLIITKNKPNEETSETYGDAFYLAKLLIVQEHFILDSKLKSIEFTEKGEDKLASLIFGLPSVWKNKRKREFLVKQALIATHFYEKNKHYLVSDNKIKIIDEFTGRIMEDRSWEQGLHQMIEAKEGCAITQQRETLAQISYQRFFRRYLRLAGTSGTVKEVEAELYEMYGLRTVKVDTNKPSKRIMLGERIYSTVEHKRQVLIERISELHHAGRPVLIGTHTVDESEQVSHWLKHARFPHQVLNAKQDKHEAEIIAQAGQKKAITVATNMAGRGTDIMLGLGVAEEGGLHVIALNKNESSRIDRQLYGRCARQGDPGSAEAILSLQDPFLEYYYSSAMLKLFAKLCPGSRPIPEWLTKLIVGLPQLKNEIKQRQLRKQVMRNDKKSEKILAFTGKFE